MTESCRIELVGTPEQIKAMMAAFITLDAPGQCVGCAAPAPAPAVTDANLTHEDPTDIGTPPPVESYEQPEFAGTGFQEGLELDKEGYPWDARINTSNKGKTAKGVWKRKPGLAEGVYEQVRTELKANITTPATQEQVDNVAASTGRVPGMDPAGNQEAPQGAAGNQEAPQGAAGNQEAPQGAAGNQEAPQGAAGNQEAPQGAAGPAMGWADFLREVTLRGLDPIAVQTACVEAGVANAAELENSPHAIPTVAARLGITQ